MFTHLLFGFPQNYSLQVKKLLPKDELRIICLLILIYFYFIIFLMPRQGAHFKKRIAAFEWEPDKEIFPDRHFHVEAGKLEQKYKKVDPDRHISPIHSSANFIFLLLEGEIHLQMAADYHCIGAGSLVIIPENMLVAFRKIKDCRGYYILFSTENILPQINKGLSEDFAFLDFEALHVLFLLQDDSIILQQSFCDIIREFNRFSTEKTNLLRHYIYI